VQGGVVGDVGVVGFTETDGADAGAEKTGVVAGELAGDLAEVHEVVRDGLLQLRVAAGVGFAGDDEDFGDGGIGETFEQDAFSDHAGGAGEDDFEWFGHGVCSLFTRFSLDVR